MEKHALEIYISSAYYGRFMCNAYEIYSEIISLHVHLLLLLLVLLTVGDEER